jgi:hypothetical protein
MEAGGVVIAALCALSLAALIPIVNVAWQRGAPHAQVCAASLGSAALALAAAFAALALGATQAPTGRFLMGIGVGMAVGLALCCATLLLLDWRLS